MVNFISFRKELEDSLRLVDLASRLLKPSTTLVTVNPEFSSGLVQLFNHKVSFLNKNQLFDIEVLNVPPPNMTQVYDPVHQEYIYFDRYLKFWVERTIHTGHYLFIDSGKTHPNILNKVRLSLQDSCQYHFISLYGASQTDVYVENINNPIFEWENTNNKNYNR